MVPTFPLPHPDDTRLRVDAAEAGAKALAAHRDKLAAYERQLVADGLRPEIVQAKMAERRESLRPKIHAELASMHQAGAENVAALQAATVDRVLLEASLAKPVEWAALERRLAGSPLDTLRGVIERGVATKDLLMVDAARRALAQAGTDLAPSERAAAVDAIERSIDSLIEPERAVLVEATGRIGTALALGGDAGALALTGRGLEPVVRLTIARTGQLPPDLIPPPAATAA